LELLELLGRRAAGPAADLQHHAALRLPRLGRIRLGVPVVDVVVLLVGEDLEGQAHQVARAGLEDSGVDQLASAHGHAYVAGVGLGQAAGVERADGHLAARLARLVHLDVNHAADGPLGRQPGGGIGHRRRRRRDKDNHPQPCDEPARPHLGLRDTGAPEK
jgi:hypothetical protein